MNELVPLPAIDTLLPHQAPMLLLDRLCTVDASRVCCETRVGTRHALLLDGEGSLPAWVGIELMAQTIAAWAGYQGWLRGEKPRLGMLLGSRNYSATCPDFAFGSELEIEVEQLMTDAGLSSFQCMIRCGGPVVAEARLSTLQPSAAQLQQLSGEQTDEA